MTVPLLTDDAKRQNTYIFTAGGNENTKSNSYYHTLSGNEREYTKTNEFSTFSIDEFVREAKTGTIDLANVHAYASQKYTQEFGAVSTPQMYVGAVASASGLYSSYANMPEGQMRQFVQDKKDDIKAADDKTVAAIKETQNEFAPIYKFITGTDFKLDVDNYKVVTNTPLDTFVAGVVDRTLYINKQVLNDETKLPGVLGHEAAELAFESHIKGVETETLTNFAGILTMLDCNCQTLTPVFYKADKAQDKPGSEGSCINVGDLSKPIYINKDDAWVGVTYNKNGESHDGFVALGKVRQEKDDWYGVQRTSR
jgi:hypothetical protein